jgi:hypothetical protein
MSIFTPVRTPQLGCSQWAETPVERLEDEKSAGAPLSLLLPHCSEPMKPESRPSSEPGLARAANLAGVFDHEFTQTPLAKRASYSGFLVAEVSSLCISSVCLITLDYPQPNRETTRCEQLTKR